MRSTSTVACALCLWMAAFINAALAQSATETSQAIPLQGLAVAGKTMQINILLPYMLAEQGLMEPCVAALEDNASTAGIEVQRLAPGEHFSWEENTTPPYRVDVVHDVNPVAFADIAPTALASMFSSPLHYSKFLSTPLYQSMLDEASCGLLCFDSGSWVGAAYAGSAHLIGVDDPPVEPADLRGRIILPTLTYSLNTLAGVGGFTLNDLLLRSKSSIAAQNNALDSYIGFDPKRHLVFAPTLLVRSIVPRELRRFLTTTMSQVSSIWFLIKDWESQGSGRGIPASEKEILQLLFDETVKECSSFYYRRELDEIAAMEREGTTLVAANRHGYRELTRRGLQEEIDSGSQLAELAKWRLKLFEAIIAAD